jgi:hypothetical protein
VSPACSWDELRRAYKVQIHQWHPDKFADKTAEKATANDKIKGITTAHQQLVVFYREHGKLPEPEAAAAPRKLPQPERKRPRAAATSNRPHHTATSKKRSGIMPIVAGIIIIVNVFWFLAPGDDFEPPVTHAKPLTTAITADAENLLAQSVATPTEAAAEIDAEFITYGSSIGEVISIQGAPTLDEGDTWYYADSELYFEDGKVIGWRHAPGSKLKTGIALKNNP